MSTVCGEDKCAGCMMCISLCTHNAIRVIDGLKSYNAVIDPEKCVDCGLCHNLCPQNIPPKLQTPVEWYQGWAEDSMRKNSSSGGAAAAVSQAFINRGGIVCSCIFSNGEFQFSFADSVKEIKKFTGSKYVKSNPRGIYPAVKELLRSGKNVLFIGLPCQAAGLRNYVGPTLDLGLYTIDLICHGTPSPQILNMFLSERGYHSHRILDIRFRKKDSFYVSADAKRIDPEGIWDKYTVGFLKGLFYTDNCYSCPYAGPQRIGDLSLGDSWGSELDESERKKGISLILCQTEKGKDLLRESALYLGKVDIEKAIRSNKQLEEPSPLPAQREIFMDWIRKGKSFHAAFDRCYPVLAVKRVVKLFLIRLGWRGLSNTD